MMKRIFRVFPVIAIALLFATPLFALETLRVKGTVTKIDTAAKSVTIQPKEGEAVTVVYGDADILDKVREGRKGEAKYAVQDGRNVGIKLRKLTAGCE